MIALQTPTQITAQQALATAQEFVAENLGNLIDVGHPSRLVAGVRAAWIVPLLLTSPGYGIVGVVGVVMIDEEFGRLIGWTPLEDVRLNVEQVTLQKQTELETAFWNLRLPQSRLAHPA